MNELLIVIVVYNRQIDDLQILKSCKDEVIDFFIYDNSSLPQALPNFNNGNLYYEHDKDNSGVSRAYNHAYKKAKELNKKLLLILDQDSEFNIGFLSEYNAAYNLHGGDYLYAPIVTSLDGFKIYSPGLMRCFVGKTQSLYGFRYSQIYSLSNKSLINSGLMIPLKVFEKVGGYNEKLKLDFSDVYFIEKYKNLNLNIVLLDVYLKHSISGDEGNDFDREYNRFKYYCLGSKEIGRALDTVVVWSPFRRLLRLTVKYRTARFFWVLYAFYLRGREI